MFTSSRSIVRSYVLSIHEYESYYEGDSTAVRRHASRKDIFDDSYYGSQPGNVSRSKRRD